METKLYFAYGSNINLEQMAFRCPDAKPVGTVTLDNYELLFRGNKSGYGVATVALKEGSQVQGLLWEITEKCEKSLDLYEGYPFLYVKEIVNVTAKDGITVPVMAYIMTYEKTRMPCVPSPEYFVGIMTGYHDNKIPKQPLMEALNHVRQEVQSFKAKHTNRGGMER